MPMPTRDGDWPKYAISEIERRWLADPGAAAGAYEPPTFAEREVTGDPAYAGATLAEPASR